MRNLLLFIERYRSVILFVIYFSLSISILVFNNSYQRSSVISSSNAFMGSWYAKVHDIESYLSLKQTNDSLALENARLHHLLKRSFFNQKRDTGSVNRLLYKQRYTYLVAEVINNSVHQKNNYITIDKGAIQGVRKGMGVICPSGIVGIVINVSENFSVIQSLLHKDTRISAMLEKNRSFGSLVWGDKIDSRKAVLRDVPSHLKIKKGDKVITSGFSLFPSGIPIGCVLRSGVRGGSYFWDIDVLLYTDFSNLQYVYVVTDKMSEEKAVLESNNKQE